jgi:hypothetical protein
VGNVAHMGELRNTSKSLVGKYDEKRSFRKPKRIWEDNIEMDLGEIG